MTASLGPHGGLRGGHAAVTTGYYLSKRHWNTVMLDGSVPGDEVLELIGHACDSVVAHLTKAQQSKLITGRPIRCRGHRFATRDRARTTDRCRTWTGRTVPVRVRSVSMRFTGYSEFPVGEMQEARRPWPGVRLVLFYLLSIWSWLGNGVPLCQGRTWPNWTSSP